MLFEFGDFVLDTQQHELRRFGVACPLEPKAFRVLSYLLTYRDRVVSKDELLDHCWEGEFVTESALVRCLKIIRQAVGDDGTRQHVIKTQRGYGYRFVANATSRPPSTAQVESPSTAPHEAFEPVAAEALKPCPQCQYPNHSARQFCSDCGQALWHSCTSCGFRNEPQAHFCGGCADDLRKPTPPAPLDSQPLSAHGTTHTDGVSAGASGERKLATVLVATLHGLEALPDIEEADEIVTQTMSQLVPEVYRVEGFVAQIAGHGLMALFGAPIACEDHVLRALHAAFGLQRALLHIAPQWHRPHDLSLDLRIALHTGPVIVGPAGPDLNVQALTQGTTCQTAIHIQQRISLQASGQAVFVSDAVRQQALGLFEFIDDGPLSLPMVSQPVAVSICTGPLSASSRLEASMAHQPTVFCGRDGEMAMLHSLWSRAHRAEGQVVCLIGEAGIGKSRLAYEFRQSLHDARLLTMRALSYGAAIPYHALLPLLRDLLGIGQQDGAEEPSRQIHLSLAALSPSMVEDAPLLMDLLGLPGVCEADLAVASDVGKQRLQKTCIQLMLQTASHRPVCLLVEDGHWLDPSSLEVLDGLVMAMATRPFLLLCPARPGFRPVWSAYSYYHQLSIAPLSDPDIDALLQARLDPYLPSQELQKLIRKQTGGNPFFIEETARAMQERGLIEPRNGIYELCEPQVSTLPDSIQDMVQARLDRLPSETKALLHLAAILGTEISLPLLNAVSHMPPDNVQQQLLYLGAAELLYETQRAPVHTYTFKHILIQEAVYHSIAKRLRQQYHRQVAHVLETQFPERTAAEPEVVAQHHMASGDPEAAIPYWHRAGQHAAARSAYVEALSHLHQGLALLAALPDTPHRIQYELALRATLGPVLMVTKGHAAPEVGQAYARAHELCEWVEKTPELFPILAGLAKFSLTRAELETAYDAGQHGLHQAHHNRDPVQQTVAHWITGASLFWQGTMVAAREHMETGLALFSPESYRAQLERYPVVPGVQCLSYLALILWYLGYPDQALDRSRESMAMAREMGHPYSLAMALFYTARLYHARHDTDATAEHAAALKQLSAQQDLGFWLAQATILEGAARMAIAPEASMAQIRQGLADYQATGAEIGVEFFLCLLAETTWQAGQREVARQTLHDAQRMAQVKGARYCESDLIQLESRWDLQFTLVNASRMESRLQHALTLSRHQKAASLELRVALSLCGLWRQQGRLAEARTLLAAVYRQFTEGFDTGDLQEATHVLDVLGA